MSRHSGRSAISSVQKSSTMPADAANTLVEIDPCAVSGTRHRGAREVRFSSRTAAIVANLSSTGHREHRQPTIVTNAGNRRLRRRVRLAPT
jgi:hypothetical protein